MADNVLAVVRRVEMKYSKPASGVIRSLARINEEKIEKFTMELNRKGRSTIEVSAKNI